MGDDKNKITIKNKKIYFNGPINKEGKLEKDITKDTFFYSKIDFTAFKMLLPSLDGATIMLRGRAAGNNVVLEGVMNEESYKKFVNFGIEEIEKEGTRFLPQMPEENMQPEEEVVTESAVTTEEAVTEAATAE